MAVKVYLSQRTDRHVTKRLNASYVQDASFGTWGTVKTDNTGLNFPWGIASDGSNIFVCDGKNNRIVKLGTDLSYVANVDVETEIGQPHAIFYDTVNSVLYVAGIKDYLTVSIARITTALVISKYNANIGAAEPNKIPKGISRGTASDDFIISGLGTLGKSIEGVGFSSLSTVTITGEGSAKYYGHVKHTDGNFYFNAQYDKYSVIMRVNSSLVNTGDSNIISKASSLVVEGLSDTILVYDNDHQQVLRYDTDLNLVETVYPVPIPTTTPAPTTTAGPTTTAAPTTTPAPGSVDAGEVEGIIELNI